MELPKTVKQVPTKCIYRGEEKAWQYFDQFLLILIAGHTVRVIIRVVLQ